MCKNTKDDFKNNYPGYGIAEFQAQQQDDVEAFECYAKCRSELYCAINHFEKYTWNLDKDKRFTRKVYLKIAKIFKEATEEILKNQEKWDKK